MGSGDSTLGGAVLIVDDEPTLRHVLARSLSDAGFAVTEAANADQATRAVTDGRFDLALVDKNLGETNGLDLIRQIKQIRSDLSCAIITAYPTIESCMEALDVGAVGYLAKPFDDLKEVVLQVTGFIEEHRRRRAMRQAVQDRFRVVAKNAAAKTAPPPRPEIRRETPLATPPRGSVPLPVKRSPILLVGPPAGWRDALEEALKKHGFSVRVAERAASGIHMFQAGVTEIVVVDDEVDRSSGLEFLAQIRQLDRDVAFLLVSKSPALSVLTGLIQLGGSGCLTKPFADAESVVRQVRAAGARCRLHRTAQNPAPERETEGKTEREPERDTK